MRRRGKVVLYGLAGLAVLSSVPWLVGSFLPEAHSVSVAREVRGGPAEVWSVLADPAAYPEWLPDVRAVEVLAPGVEGPRAWRQTSRWGSVTYRRVAAEAPRRLLVEIADRDLPYGGRWTYALERSGGGTRVTITEDGVVHSRVFRFLGRFVIGNDATARSFLEALGARMEGGTRTPSSRPGPA